MSAVMPGKGPLSTRRLPAARKDLFQKRKLSSGSVTNHLAALRLFYIQTLKKAWSVVASFRERRPEVQFRKSR